MKLTIGTATFDDFDGLYFTLQALRLGHADVMRDTEIVVVDNNPSSRHGEAARNLGGHLFGRTPEAVAQAGGEVALGGFQYVPYTDAIGTAAPRDLIFRRARGDFVLCLDSHVLLWPGALAKLLMWLDANHGSQDLISGPLVYDSLNTYSTHFEDAWDDGMWGKWSTAWACPKCEELLSTRQEEGRVAFYTLPMPQRLVTACSACGLVLPALGWSRHEDRLRKAGWREAASDLYFPPFEIPAQGLGLFGCRREAWLGFNPNFRGFGGEEHYIHEKYRQAGRKNLCLPFLRWVHRFGRVEGVAPYPVNGWYKARNYVIGHTELGLPLERVKEHFVPRIVPENEWSLLMQNPANPVEWPPNVPRQGVAQTPRTGRPAPVNDLPQVTLEGLYAGAAGVPSDFSEHVPRLRELASKCDSVVEFGKRPTVTTVAILAAQPPRFSSYEFNSNQTVAEILQSVSGNCKFSLTNALSLEVEIPECDLLFIDSKHTAAHLGAQLSRHAHKVSHWLVFHDTVLYGERGEDGGPGLNFAIRDFISSHPEWFVMSFAPNNYGLTILSRSEADRPATPVHAWAPGHGPGTELKTLLAEAGINPGSHCDCNALALAMDEWGVVGCKAHREEIVEKMKANYERWGWKEKLGAVLKASTSGSIWGRFLRRPSAISDPVGGLVDMAIERAEAKAGVQ